VKKIKDKRFKINDLGFRIYYLLYISFSILFLISYILPPILTVFAQENANVSLTVNPRASDFQFVYTSTDGLTTVAQGTELSYQITYGAQASASFGTTVVLEVDYSDDMAPGGSHVLDYVLGSAGNAYGGAVPVVDLENRTITWTITNLPAGTINQTVDFKLKTNSNYTGEISVAFTTKASMSNQYITMPDQTITQYYQYSLSITPTPTPTAVSNPTATPGVPAAPVASPVPTAAPIPLHTPPRITDIDFSNITSTSAVIVITTSPGTRQTVFYGTSPTLLSQKAESTNYASLSRVSLTGLRSNTAYYFRVESTDRNGNKARSEIFTFKTAEGSSESFVIDEGALTIESMGSRVYSKIIDKSSPAGFAFLTEHTDFTLSYTPKFPIDYRSLDVVIRGKDNAETIITVNLFRKNSSLYISQLKTRGSGMYEIYLKARDRKGNLTEQKVIDLKVSPRLAVFEKGSNKPIGDARVFLFYYNSKTNKFEPLTKEMYGDVRNPAFTNSNGTVNILLPTGRYRVEASAFLHDRQVKEFTLGQGAGEEFPQIFLNKDSFSIVNITRFLRDWMSDLFNNFIELMHVLNTSTRLFNIAAFTTGIISIIATILFTFKTHMDPKKLPVFFLFGLHMLIKKHRENFVFGTIVDEKNIPVLHARIELIHKDTGEVITHSTSNKLGRFHFHKISTDQDVLLRIGKDGCKEIEIVLGEKAELNIVLKKAGSAHQAIDTSGIKIIEHLGGSLFETMLIISILIEILFLLNFGVVKTLPFFALSIFNILLWVFYLKEKNS
jgi:hypothetical protein